MKTKLKLWIKEITEKRTDPSRQTLLFDDDSGSVYGTVCDFTCLLVS